MEDATLNALPKNARRAVLAVDAPTAAPLPAQFALALASPTFCSGLLLLSAGSFSFVRLLQILTFLYYFYFF